MLWRLLWDAAHLMGAPIAPSFRFFVIAGLDPAISRRPKDGRVTPGHDVV